MDGHRKMASNKVIGTETLNGDNMKGFYSADGATYVYTDGHEYLDIFLCGIGGSCQVSPPSKAMLLYQWSKATARAITQTL